MVESLLEQLHTSHGLCGVWLQLAKSLRKGPGIRKQIVYRTVLEAVPLTPDERAIAEGDLEKLETLIRKLDDVPTLDGRTPSEIGSKNQSG